MEGWQERKAGICAYNMIDTLFLTYVKKDCEYSDANGKLY